MPVILSEYKYVAQHDSSISHTFMCGSRPFKIKPNQGFLFRSKPPPKLNCFALFYIDPINCPSWTHNLWAHEGEKFSKVFPASLLDPLYDFRIHFEAYRSKYRTNFVHIETLKPVTYYKSEDFITTFIYLADHLWTKWPAKDFDTMGRDFRIPNFVPPNKFTYRIAYNHNNKRYSVIESYIHTCDNSVMTLRLLRKYCKAKDKSKRLECQAKVRRYSSTNMLGKISFNSSIPVSWKYLEHLKETQCRNQVIKVHSYESYDTTRPWYLREWKIDQSLEPMFLSILCPNCSILFPDINDLKITLSLANLFVFKSVKVDEFTHSTHIDALHFVTCFPTRKHTFLSFLGYISAFDLYTWLLLLVSMVLTITIYTVASHIDHKKVASRWSYSVVAMYAMLLRQGIPDANRAKWLTGSWLLASIIVTFFYEGDNVEKMTVPFKAQGVDTFEKMFQENFTILTPHLIEASMRPLITHVGLHFPNQKKLSIMVRWRRWNLQTLI